MSSKVNVFNGRLHLFRKPRQDPYPETFLSMGVFRILKRPFDVKRSSDSKYAIFMSLARREVHEFLVFLRQKSFKIDLLKRFQKVQKFF